MSATLISSSRLWWKSLFRYVPPLLLVTLLLTTCGKRNPSNDEIMAYRAGWSFGGLARNADHETQQNTLDGMLSQLPSEQQDWMKEGFEDGLKGRDARYEVPHDLFEGK